MCPKDDEDFSTLQPDDIPPPTSASPPARQPTPVRPKVVPEEPKVVSILSSESTQEICSRIPLSDRARQSIDLYRVPIQCFDHLVRLELFEDATRLLAHALPRREAIGWALVCSRQAHGRQPTHSVEAALSSSADWLLNPGETRRLAAMKSAEAAGLETPAGRVCAAVFLSFPDFGLPMPHRMPSKNYAAIGVAAAVLCSATWGNAATKSEWFGRLLAYGRTVAVGARPWESGK